MGANCGVSVISVSSCWETALCDTVRCKDGAHLVPSCVERGWLGRAVAGSRQVCAVTHAVLQEGIRSMLHRLHSTHVDLAF